jgi:hypothetical protein
MEAFWLVAYVYLLLRGLTILSLLLEVQPISKFSVL